MRAKLIVENAGFFTTVQDMGRFGYQQFGVPVSGAMDKYALQVANMLVGNSRGEAALEITLPGFAARFSKSCQIAVTGADLGAVLGERPLSPWQAVTVKEGELLSFNTLKGGTRSYLAVAGGFALPEVMGSKSTYVRGRIGGLEGRQLQEGDELEIKGDPFYARPPLLDTPPAYKREYASEVTVRCVPGPQDDFFLPAEVEKFFSFQYTVTQQSDRMGYRLDGPVVKHKQDYNIITEGLTLGAVQMIGEGKPIVMMADHQSAGGYTKIAHVINVDMHFLAQMKPGDKVSFQKIGVEEAQELLRQQEEKLQQLEEHFSAGVEAKAEAEGGARGQEKEGLEKGKTRQLRLVVNGKEYTVQVEEVNDI